jgi:hypothetical protein
MKYAVEMGSGAMIYIPSFIRIGITGPDTVKNRQHSVSETGPLSILT